MIFFFKSNQTAPRYKIATSLAKAQWWINDLRVQSQNHRIIFSWEKRNKLIIECQITPTRSWQVSQHYTETPQAHEHMPAATSVSDKTTKASGGSSGINETVNITYSICTIVHIVSFM